MSGFLNTIRKVRDIDFSDGHILRYSILYIILFGLIAFALYLLLEKKSLAISAIYLLCVGYATRMALALSPTIFASEERTFIPFILTVFVVCLLLLREMPIKIKS